MLTYIMMSDISIAEEDNKGGEIDDSVSIRISVRKARTASRI